MTAAVIERPTSALQTLPAPYHEADGVSLYWGTCEEILPHLAPHQFGGLIADPPYCSGGMLTTTRTADPVEKYAQNGKACGRPTFNGDSRDQRGFLNWTSLWLRECRRVLCPSAYLFLFTDWRQLPTATDAIQASGLTWRGTAVWDKGRGSRAPHKGYLRHQSEFILWGTHGKCPPRTDAGPFDAVYRLPVLQKDKHHLTGKPTGLLRELCQIIPAGQVILDPFAGSGTTGVAARQTGRLAVLIEQSEACCEIAARRLDRGE